MMFILLILMIALSYSFYMVLYRIDAMSDVASSWNSKVSKLRHRLIEKDVEAYILLPSYHEMYSCLMDTKDMFSIRHMFKTTLEDFIVDKEMYELVMKLDRETK